MTEEQNAVEAVATPTPKILEPSVQTLRARFAKRKSRAVEKNDVFGQWTADFDLECLVKGGGLINISEKSPFIDCRTLDEHLHTARIYAFAFRHAGIDVPDIQPDETVDRFCFRVHRQWYSIPVGKVMFLVGLRTKRFDDDMGMRREEFDFDATWEVLPFLTVTVDVAALQPIGLEPRVPPLPEWKKAGFACYEDYKEDLDEKERKRKAHEELEQYLEKRDAEKKPSEPAESTPTLLYKATLSE
jgi:hypothetical protein